MEALSGLIREDLMKRLPNQRKTQRDKLSTLVSLVLRVQSCNLMVLAAALPRKIQEIDKRYQYIERFLSNEHVHVSEVMGPFAEEVITKLSQRGETVILMIDQSQIRGDLQVLMISVRFGNRALPVLWCVKKTGGNIGFDAQKELLEQVKSFIPDGVNILLSGDRFYGTADLINLCQGYGWDYRLRLKGNMLVYQDKGEKALSSLFQKGHTKLVRARLVCGAVTNIGIIHEPGHPEPWIIAMNATPSEYRVLDYGFRWGIESMFSDFKSRGFGITKTHIQKTDRLERLLLILSLALYWAVSTGLWCKNKQVDKNSFKKNNAP